MDEHLTELYEEAKRLFDEGKYHEAEPLLKEVHQNNPSYADVLNRLGIIANLKGEMRKAAEYFEEALRINPKYTEAALNLAITYNDLGEFKKAQDVFSMAAQVAHPEPGMLDPFAAGKLANEHYRIGNIYLDFGMYEEAIDEYRKALRLSSGFPDVHTKLGIALRNVGHFEDAIIHFNAAKEINPGYGQAWVQLGLTYYMKGLTGLAIEEWETALRKNPDLRDARNYLQIIRKEEQ
jgi:tetratricopeptide (TPR) repeat protein